MSGWGEGEYKKRVQKESYIATERGPPSSLILDGILIIRERVRTLHLVPIGPSPSFKSYSTTLRPEYIITLVCGSSAARGHHMNRPTPKGQGFYNRNVWGVGTLN